MEPDLAQTDPGLESLRLHRAELLESIRTLEQALAAPAAGRTRPWAERVNVALVELTADFREHIGLTEGPDGLYHDVLATSPRLTNAVNGLTAEHAQIEEMTARLLDRLAEASSATHVDVDGVRDDATMLLSRLSRHRQRGADLVYEAFELDIGGET